jgi:predicted MFS family arabinose efflux permease
VLAFSVWMGITYMAVLPPITGLIGGLCGAARLPTLLGITFVVHQVGAFLGSWLGGVVLEATGSYDGMWMLDMTLAALATGVSLTVREQARRPSPVPRLAVQA